jgi:hypothetical protein
MPIITEGRVHKGHGHTIAEISTDLSTKAPGATSGMNEVIVPDPFKRYDVNSGT